MDLEAIKHIYIYLLISVPTFVGDSGQESWIDVSAVSLNLLNRVSSWQVVESAGLGSDHALLCWDLSSTPQIGNISKENQLEKDRLDRFPAWSGSSTTGFQRARTDNPKGD